MRPKRLPRVRGRSASGRRRLIGTAVKRSSTVRASFSTRYLRRALVSTASSTSLIVVPVARPMSLMGCRSTGSIQSTFFSPLTGPCRMVFPGRGANRNSTAFFDTSAVSSAAPRMPVPNSMNRFGYNATDSVSCTNSTGLRTTSTTGEATLPTKSRLRRRGLSTVTGRCTVSVSSHRLSTSRTSAQPSAMLCWMRLWTAVVFPR